MFDLTKKTDSQKSKFILDLHAKLKSDRIIFEPLMEIIEKLFTPRSYKLLKDGDKEAHGAAVYQGVPETAKNKFVRGTTGYLVSRQPWWLRMVVSDQVLMREDSVKLFLDEMNEQMKFSFNRSTFYEGLPHCIEDGVTTGPGILMPEYNELEHKVYYKPISHWQTWIMDDDWGNPVVYHQELELTAVDAVNKFGKDALPKNILAQAEGRRGKPFDKSQYIYAIYKNPNHDPKSIRTEDMPFIGYYICLSSSSKKGSLVEELGRPWFPIVLRMNRLHGMAYNTNRTLAAEALTESKMTNSLKKAKLNAAHKSVDPPLWGPKGLTNRINRNAGGYTGIDTRSGETIQRLIEGLNWPVSDAEATERDRIIEDKFFVRFFELLSQEDLPQITAFQASLMAGEKAILMGPITEPIEEHVLTKAVEIQAYVEAQAFLMPNVPDILRERASSAQPQFDGPLTQLRRNLLSSKGTLTGLGVLGEVLKLFPDSSRKVNDLELLEDVSVESGAKQSWFKSDEEMLKLDTAIAEQQQQQQQQQAMLEAAKAAPGVSGPVDDDSVLAKAGEVLGA